MSCSALRTRLNFYPRSPRGERLYTVTGNPPAWIISIHAPREGSDQAERKASCTIAPFLSTLPARGATALALELVHVDAIISIHAPREGSDPFTARRTAVL